MTTPQLPAVAEAANLTAVLRKAGALDHGAVREVTVLYSRDTILSHITRLGLDYVGAVRWRAAIPYAQDAPSGVCQDAAECRQARSGLLHEARAKNAGASSCRAASMGISTSKVSPGISCSKT